MRAIAAFFMGSWGILLGLFFAGFFIASGHPVKPLDHLLWGGYTLLFSSMVSIGLGRFIGDIKFGKTLAIIAGVVIALVFSLRVMGILPVV
jgi:hypothetical protein